MAKKKQETEAAAETPVVALIKASTLKALLKEDDRYKGQIEGLTGELREAIGNAVEKKNLDKEAYAALKKIRRMRIKKGAERARMFWDTLLAYLDLSGEMALIESAPGLDLPVDDPQEPAEDPENVERPQFGGPRQLAEAIV